MCTANIVAAYRSIGAQASLHRIASLKFGAIEILVTEKISRREDAVAVIGIATVFCAGDAIVADDGIGRGATTSSKYSYLTDLDAITWITVVAQIMVGVVAACSGRNVADI